MTPILTTFDRSMSSDILTVSEWKHYGTKVLSCYTSWETAARHHAKIKGGSFVMQADDTLIVFTRLADGSIRKTTYKPGSWKWEA